jgi:hypothetical protein
MFLFTDQEEVIEETLWALGLQMANEIGHRYFTHS